MKSILISIKPRHCANILNRLKTIEIRKTMPKCDFPIKVYIYCTKDKKNELYKYSEECGYFCNDFFADLHRQHSTPKALNGKVVASFVLKNVEIIGFDLIKKVLFTDKLDEKELLEKSCLSFKELTNYFGSKCGYAWHITKLEIFDTPKELREFKRPYYCDCKLRCWDNLKPSFCRQHCSHNLDSERLSVCCDRDGWVKEWNNENKLTKAPQSWCYCDVEE